MSSHSGPPCKNTAPTPLQTVSSLRPPNPLLAHLSVGRDLLNSLYVFLPHYRNDKWMNIKNLSSAPILPVDPKQRVEGNNRARSSGDRDGNGRQEQPEQESKRHLNQQEFDDAIKALQETPGLKSNHLTIKVEVNDDIRVVLIVAPDGSVVRRLSEAQLWTATRDKDRHTGKILDKAM